MPHARLLLAEAAQHDSGGTLVVDVIVIVCLILVGGLMSGLTLGLMSLDAIDLELLPHWLQVLKRSGTPREKLYAARIQPVLRNPHWTLVTLLLCNAAALEALPIFLDKLVSPVLAIILSVTAVLTFGEIIPQAACKSYALIIGAYTAWLVRILRVAVGIISWPIAKVLDWVLGKEHSALFRRAQLKALVNMHSIDENFGGHLSPAEIGIIGGALDLTHKTAAQGMTPLEQVFALPTDAILNVETLRSILATGHSRVPVHAPGNKAHILGLLLVKELVLVDLYANIAVSTQKVRALPHLRADTAMYDLLKLFQSGRTHMVVLTRPPKESAAALAAAKAAEALRDGADPAELPGTGFLTKSELKEASVKGDSKAAATPPADVKDQSEGAPDPAVLTRVSGATHSSQASHQALVKDGAVKDVREPPLADLAVQIDPKTVSAAVAQAHRSASLSSRNYSVLDTAAATPEDTLGIITIEDVIEELIGQEIVDETDTHHDNLKQHRVAKSQLASGSPRMRALLQQYQTAATMEAGFSGGLGVQGSEQSGTSSSGGSMFGGSGAGQIPIPLPAAAGKPAVRRKVFKSHSAKHLDHPRSDPSKLFVEDGPMERQPSAQSTKL